MSYFLGEIILFGGIKIPPGFLPCDGREIRVKDNPALYTIILNNYGGTPDKTFCLPDLRGRAPIGYTPHWLQGRNQRRLGETGGQEEGVWQVPIKEENLPPHGHEVTGEVKVKVKVSSQEVNTGSADKNYLGQRPGSLPGSPDPGYVDSTASGVIIDEVLGGVEVETKLATSKTGSGQPLEFKMPRDPYLTIRYLICVGNKGVDAEYPGLDEDAHDM